MQIIQCEAKRHITHSKLIDYALPHCYNPIDRLGIRIFCVLCRSVDSRFACNCIYSNYLASYQGQRSCVRPV